MQPRAGEGRLAAHLAPSGEIVPFGHAWQLQLPTPSLYVPRGHGLHPGDPPVLLPPSGSYPILQAQEAAAPGVE